MSKAYYSNPHATSPGLVYIFNFTQHNEHSTVRVGSTNDVDRLKSLFVTLFFEPEDIHVKEDLSETDLFESLYQIINFNQFHKYRSLWIFILTHGCENDFLYAADVPFHISKIKLALTSSINWIGIPKLVVVQACRGSETDVGLTLPGNVCDGGSDAEGEVADYNVPTTSDTIFFHSTWQGFASFRTTDGTPFVRFFVKNMERYFYSADIVKIFTKVCRDVGYNCACTKCMKLTSKFKQLKQMPCFEHSFMYRLHFGRDFTGLGKRERIELEQYKMNRPYRGFVIFFYQKDYSLHNMSNRSADGDLERLSPLLNSFYYEVQIEVDKTETEVRKILETTSNRSFSNYDSLMIIFSGHGIADKLFLREGFIFTNEIWDTFMTVKTLIRKPKLFFISACRGGRHDRGSIGEIVLPTDMKEGVNQPDVVTKYDSDEPHTMPITADILAVFSSAPDYVSIVDVNQRGTFFLIELYNILSQLEKEENIMDIIYRLNETLAKQITKDLRAEKQISFALSSLTKELYFPNILQSAV